ncbi:LysR family transcriptional regulator [Actinotalea sp. C106]|uniref:LysR family transcriptional regulator n=1 Tax=Actinotalea sp. C106 TaxID=2908644 RepID=UPI0020286683|nr:LysR family transcriptional regulator [Actinotalea sp. C106]
MPLNPWRLRLLDVFDRVGTVRGVAAELLLSPSSVSQQLALLETETRSQLFERSGRTLRLTPTGRILVERARDLRDHMDSIEVELLDVTRGTAGHLRVAGFASSIEPLLIPALQEVQEKYPGLQIEIQEIEPRASTAALEQGLCDIAITVDEEDGALLVPGVTTVPLTTDPLQVVVPAGHRVAALDVVPLAELAQDRWALDLPGTYLGELVPRQCRREGFEPIVAGRFSSYGVLLAHVSAGLSVAVLPELAIPARPGLVRRPTTGLADRRIVAAVRRANRGRPAVAAVIEILQRRAQDLGGVGAGPAR